jgi:outer membrane protein OmpA-like peptidoglycan-associated protein
MRHDGGPKVAGKGGQYMRSPAGAIFRHKSSACWRFCVTAGAARRGELMSSASGVFRSPQTAGEPMNAPGTKLRAAALGLVVSGCTLLPAYADETPDDGSRGSKQTRIGAVTGIALGAAAAGPVGAVMGAAAGVAIGDRYRRQAQTTTALTQDLDQSEAVRAQLAHSVAELNYSLAAAQARGEQLDQVLQHTGQLEFDVNFRTGDDAVTAQAMAPLLKLGGLVASLPQTQVLVAGFADPRGSEAYNDALSFRRAECVAAVLASAGVPRERILIEARGKSAALSAPGDHDGYALDRRVTVRLLVPGRGQVASRD